MRHQINYAKTTPSCQWGRRRTLQVACDATQTSRRSAVAAPLLLLPTVNLQPASAAVAASAPAAGPWSFHRRQLLSLLSVSNDYDRYAESYDRLDSGAIPEALGFAELRQQLVGQAYGDVLEVAVGTGLNLPLYNPARLSSLTAVDISPGMLQQAAPRGDELSRRMRLAGGSAAALTATQPPPTDLELVTDQQQQQGGAAAVAAAAAARGQVRFLVADAASLQFPDGSFDCVLDTFSLCVFEQPGRAVREVARVLRKGGRLLLLEHTRSDNPLLGAYQDITNPAVRPLSKGCAWNQDVEGFVRAAGLKLVSAERHLGGTITLLSAERV